MPDTAPDMNDPRFSRDLSLDGERHKVAALLALLEAQGFGDDDEIILTAIEGETDAMEAVSTVIRLIAEDEARAAALKDLEGQYSARRSRYEERAKLARQVLLRFMQDIGQKKIERPEATLTLSAGKQSVGFAGEFDAKTLPADCQKVSVDPDRAKIKELLDAGHSLPGCFLTNSSTTLTMRRK